MAKSYHLLAIFISQSTPNLNGCIISVYLFILSLFRDRALLSSPVYQNLGAVCLRFSSTGLE